MGDALAMTSVKIAIPAAALLSSMAMGSSMSEDKMRVMKGRGTPRCP